MRMIEVRSLTPREARLQAEIAIEAAQKPYYRRPKSDVTAPLETSFNSLASFFNFLAPLRRYVLGTQIVRSSEKVFLAKPHTPYPEGVRILAFEDVPDQAAYICYTYNPDKPVKIRHVFHVPEDYEFK